MSVKFLLIATVCLLAIIQEGSGQSNRFIVLVAGYTRPNTTPNTVRCAGTVITQSHVLSSAVCADVDEPTALVILIQTNIIGDGEETNSVATSPAQRAFIHPDYVRGQNRANNIAVIFGPNSFGRIYELPARSLGGLTTNSSCNLFGWGGAPVEPLFDPVRVYGSAFCDQSSPQLFCSTFDSPIITTCSAMPSSPVVCTSGRVDGILLNNRVCTVAGQSNRLYYQSIGDYHAWIEQVTAGADITARSSVYIILSAIVITLKSLA